MAPDAFPWYLYQAVTGVIVQARRGRLPYPASKHAFLNKSCRLPRIPTEGTTAADVPHCPRLHGHPRGASRAGRCLGLAARWQVLWSQDEVIVACALVVRNGWLGLRVNDGRVVEMSALLR